MWVLSALDLWRICGKLLVRNREISEAYPSWKTLFFSCPCTMQSITLIKLNQNSFLNYSFNQFSLMIFTE